MQPSAAWFSHFGVRRLRLASGLVLFAYVTTHLTGHALANISLAATDWAFWFHGVVWADRPGQYLLYAALATHLLLALWAIYVRPRLGWSLAEALQVGLGFCIPLLLATHVVDTRGNNWIFGAVRGYPQVLQSLWVWHPWLGAMQAVAVLVAWVHGCIGLYFWLRLRPFFARWSPVLLCVATLLPALSLLGFVHGGQAVMARQADPAWQRSYPPPEPAVTARLAMVRDNSLYLFAASVVLVLAVREVARLRELRRRSVRIAYPGVTVRVPHGASVLEASVIGRVPHAHVCGGRGRCSTCRIRVTTGAVGLPPPSPAERAVLTRIRAASDVRLACQFRPAADIAVVPMLPPDLTAGDFRRHAQPMRGEERFIVVMVVDMRNSTALAQHRMPFDAVFIIDRFVAAVGHAVVEAGGVTNQFTGDGVFALFGLACGPEEACRQAVLALAGIGRNVAALRQDADHVLQGQEGAERVPFGFGVGVHCGTAVVGEIAFGGSRIFTALGDPANIASRLEKLCKKFRCEAVISEEVCRLSGFPLAELPQHSAELAGVASAMPVRVAARTAGLVG